MIKVLIIEDERATRHNLKRSLITLFDDIEVIEMLDSVSSATEWLNENPDLVDIIFLDIQLSDGIGLSIFDHCEVRAKIIITTAFEQYAVDAFKLHSVDYLLKPIDDLSLIKAVNYCKSLIKDKTVDISLLQNLINLNESGRQSTQYRERFLVKIGDRIFAIRTEQIAYFHSEEKATFIVTHDDKRYIIDESLDSIENYLDDKTFFRVARSHIVSFKSISQVTKYFGSRLMINLHPKYDKDLFISRARVSEFMDWLKG